MLNRKQVMDMRALLTKDEAYRTAPGSGLRSIDPAIMVDMGDVLEERAEPGVAVAVPGPAFVAGRSERPEAMQALVPKTRHVPDKNLRVFQQAQIVGWRSLVTPTGFYSSARAWLNGDRSSVLSSFDDGFVPFGERIHYRSFEARRPIARPGLGLFLGYLEPGNYGSFLFRALPKLLYALAHPFRFDYVISPERMPFLRSFLDQHGYAHMPVYNCQEAMGMRFEQLIAIDDFDAEGTFCARSMDRLRGLTNPSTDQRRIYCSRRLSMAYRPHYRPLLNEDEVEDFFVERGFEIIYPETMSLQAQMNVFSEAGYVAGPSGSGMFNSLFSPEGCLVMDLESFIPHKRQHLNLYGSSGKRYGLVFGSFDPEIGSSGADQFRPWRISQDDLRSAYDNTLEMEKGA